jgi:hypothetical protein
MKKTLHTGGALGSDECFAKLCTEAGFDVVIHSFEGHKVAGEGNIIIHTPLELLEADEYLQKVAEFIKRPFPLKNNYTNNLLRRNYLIIKNVNSVYAIGNIESEYVVEGGTGWACELARQLDKELFVYNLYDKVWYTRSGNTNYWPLACGTPLLDPCFAGIGTRGLNLDGKKAIKKLLGL